MVPTRSALERDTWEGYLEIVLQLQIWDVLPSVIALEWAARVGYLEIVQQLQAWDVLPSRRTRWRWLHLTVTWRIEKAAAAWEVKLLGFALKTRAFVHHTVTIILFNLGNAAYVLQFTLIPIISNKKTLESLKCSSILIFFQWLYGSEHPRT
jgi:hypothetical protein